MKTEADKEIKERRNELTRQERRLDQKEEALDRKVANMEQKKKSSRNGRNLPRQIGRNRADPYP